MKVQLKLKKKKISLEGLGGRFGHAEERINELKDKMQND